MPLSISTNLMAGNAARTLGAHYNRLSASVRRLSSGLRVNAAADDAAGLAIRELMRADVAALNQGVRNANDAISMIQVADGALAVIDEKLIRMKELAEQAATGTYTSTQRLMIDSEFQAMASEIDRIANATDFNGIKLLDGSLTGAHNGSGLTSTGAMKIHFGTGNDSAEDYYYVEIGDCTIASLGLAEDRAGATVRAGVAQVLSARADTDKPTLNDYAVGTSSIVKMPAAGLGVMQDLFQNVQGRWASGQNAISVGDNNFMFLIPKGTKNILINTTGGGSGPVSSPLDNDIQLFTRDGKHLAGTPLDDYVYDSTSFQFQFPPNVNYVNESTALADNCDKMGFSLAQYDPQYLNSGPAHYDADNMTLRSTTYNGMTIGYSGDPERQDNNPNNGVPDKWGDYELLTIDEATEDLVVWLPGYMSASIKLYWDLPDDAFSPPYDVNPPGNNPSPPGPDNPPLPLGPDDNPSAPAPGDPASGGVISIETQEKAQQALERIDDAIVAKDTVRAHLGALQNRLENTITNLSIQAENLQSAESRISDVDVATEMTAFARNQILTQSAIAVLGQANSFPHMLMSLLER